MKITELSTRELWRFLRATEKALGPDSASVLALRRELAPCRTNVARHASLRIGHWQLVLLSEVNRLPRPPPRFRGTQ